MDNATRFRLAKLRSECGCRAGSVALLVSVGAYVFYAVWMDPVIRTRRERVIIGVCVGLTGALVGKILGVLWARYQYRQLFTARAPRGNAAIAVSNVRRRR